MILITLLIILFPVNHVGSDILQPHYLQRPRRSLMVPLHQRSHPSWRRHLLRSGALAVHGSVREVGYFYTNLMLGTPAREFSVIIDTGSTITYIPCKGCAHCGKHQDEWFDPDSSSTAKKLTCNDALCNCGSPSCACNNDRCYYSRTYAERSSSEGWMVEDVFGFPDDQPAVRMVFGCENGETGEIYRQMADGIMGMGNNHNAFQSQLVERGIIEDVFSLCFGYPKDGILLLGDVEMPAGAQTVYSPLLSNLHLHYYNIKMEGISVDGVALPLNMDMFSSGYGTVLDSGTTFTYLPTEAYRAMAAAIGSYAKAHGLELTTGVDPQYNDICYKGAPDNFEDLDKYFPHAEFVLGDQAHLFLPPLRYLFLSQPSEYCLGVFDNGGSGTLIGGVSVRDVVITYDRRNSRVGLTTMPCADVAAKLASRSTSMVGPSNITLLDTPPASPSAYTDTNQQQPSPAGENLTATQSQASLMAGATQVEPSEQRGPFAQAALDVNYAIIFGVIAAIAVLFVVGELVFLQHSSFVTFARRTVERVLGNRGRTGVQDEAEATPLTGDGQNSRRADVEDGALSSLGTKNSSAK